MIFSGLRHVLNSEFLDKEPVIKSIKNKKVIQKMAKWFRLLLIGLCINLAPTVSGQGVGYGKAVIKYLGSMFLMADGCPQVWSLNQNLPLNIVDYSNLLMLTSFACPVCKAAFCLPDERPILLLFLLASKTLFFLMFSKLKLCN